MAKYRSSKEIDLANHTKEAIVQVFADGGPVGRNPSPIGGTYAYIIRFRLPKWTEWIEYRRQVGFIAPSASMEVITNNVCELVAVCTGIIESFSLLEEPTDVLEVFSDSEVTLLRLFGNVKVDGLPPYARVLFKDARFILRNLGQRANYTLLQGHPTIGELQDGVGKSGRPVHALQHEMHGACSKLQEQVKKALKNNRKGD